MSISESATLLFDMFNKILSFFFWLNLHFFVAMYNGLMYNSININRENVP